MQQAEDGSIYWTEFDRSDTQIKFFIPRGQTAYNITLAARVDNRQDSIELPLQVRVENAYGLYLIDTVVLRLVESDMSERRSSVAMREMAVRLSRSCMLPMAGLYSLTVQPLQEADVSGLVAIGIELTEEGSHLD
ncbi:MAG: hypothetical protein Q4A64_01200 [Porphyromonadaceae bacterium]|nr:hypothetical protein [Porphyromonadaceae bacterium]